MTPMRAIIVGPLCSPFLDLLFEVGELLDIARSIFKGGDLVTARQLDWIVERSFPARRCHQGRWQLVVLDDIARARRAQKSP